MTNIRPKAWHCITRAKERYGLNLTTVDVRDMENQILAGTSVLTKKHDNGDEEHLVRIDDRVLRVVWRIDGCVITTVLPQGASARKRRKA